MIDWMTFKYISRLKLAGFNCRKWKEVQVMFVRLASKTATLVGERFSNNKNCRD